MPKARDSSCTPSLPINPQAATRAMSGWWEAMTRWAGAVTVLR